MNRLTPIIALLSMFGLGALQATEVKPLVVKMRPTHEGLAKLRADEAGKSTLPAGLIKAEPGAVKPRKSKVTSLIARSTVISFGGQWTIVPKGAVMYVPASLQSRIGGAREGRLLPWAEFYARNRGWLTQQPVEVSHARGDKELSEEVVGHIRGGSRVVVATCHNGPISMKKPKPEETAKPQAATEAAK